MPRRRARLLDEVLAQSSDDLTAWLAGVGMDQLAFAAGDLLIPGLGEVATRITKPPRAGNLGPRRAAIARCEGISLDDESKYQRIGSRALAPHLASDPIGRLQLTRRLVRRLGLVIEAELHAHAAIPLADGPSWAAIVAR
jgi:hypothetical protein